MLSISSAPQGKLTGNVIVNTGSKELATENMLR